MKLYAEARVAEVERDDTFLAAQARAADARARAEQAREVREARRAGLLEAAAGSYVPVVHPEPLRKGAVRKAREPYLRELERVQTRLEQEIGRVTVRESAVLATLLRKRLDQALAATYPWYPGSGAQTAPVNPRRPDPATGATGTGTETG
ncbi:hypothetical protein ACFSC4_03195 [Deinococcus malanensis]|uniref:hypothetical protein n=1 Tax=Deinococcus malanensis TaxID=1706855 RepID=UPI00363D5809